jgi:alpha-beta hydrolase superfamily lysophospholipase
VSTIGRWKGLRRHYLITAITAGAFVLLIPVLLPLLVYRIERAVISTGPNGPATPASLGIPYEPVRIASANRFLDSYFVEASAECRQRHALLIFQGRGGTISAWVHVQRFLYDRCISSTVFDYSGNGDSSPMQSIGNLREDAIAVYNWLYARSGATARVCVFGFSMGASILLDAYSDFRPPPPCIILGGAMTSARDFATQSWGIPRWLATLAPDQWNGSAAISSIHSSLLVVHGDADHVIPLRMSERLYQAAPQPKQFAVVHGLPHSAVLGPLEPLWSVVAQFIEVGAVTRPMLP